MSKLQDLYFGYELMEEWRLVGVRPDQPVMVNLNREVVGEKFGLRTERLAVEVSQADENNRVHYCRIYVGQIQTVNGIGMTRQDGLIGDEAGKILEQVREWLKESGCEHLRTGRISAPMALRMMEGKAGFLSDTSTN